MQPHHGALRVVERPQHRRQGQRPQPHRMPPQQLQVPRLARQQEQHRLPRVAHARGAADPVHIPGAAQRGQLPSVARKQEQQAMLTTCGTDLQVAAADAELLYMMSRAG